MDPNSCQLVVTGLQGKREIFIVPKTCTIDHLYDEVKKRCASTVSVDELRLVYGGSELERGKGMTIESYDIPPMGQIFMVVRLRGGPGGMGSAWIRLPLLLPWSLTSNDEVLTTFDQDIITLDSDFDNARIRMPCGHAIGADSLLHYCCSVLDGGQRRISCPLCTCEWSFGFIRKALKKMALGVVDLDSKMTEIVLGNTTAFQKCPGSCSVWTYRDPAEVTSQVLCPLCQHRYCWVCLRNWRSPNDFCGNIDCAMGIDPRIQFLKSQPLKIIGPVSGCPSVRGCPRCGTLLEHREACKHMACKSCLLQFCFVCLKPLNVLTKQWQCGAHNSACPIAPQQTTLPTI